MKSSIVIRPDFLFEQTSRELAALGWVLEPDALVAPPILPGEPEVAAWRHQDRAASLSYSFNPVVFLRKLTFDGGTAAEDLYSEVARRLPSLDLAALRLLLQSRDESQLLLGVLAALELRAFDAIDLLDALRDHSHERVAAAAQEAHGEMLRLWLEAGAERLREEKRRHPDRSALFPHLGDAHMRRQTLRWLIRDYKESNEHIEAVIRSGLVDEDWEVRASAILAAVRLGARSLWADVKSVELVPGRERPDETYRTILHAAHKVALARLTNESVDDDDDERALMRRHLFHCMMGQPVERHDRIFLFINALTEPLEIEDEAPPALECVEEEDGRYRLKNTGIELCWIAALPHWLGADDTDLTVQNPIRRVVPSKGFFIARRPLSVSQARSLGASVVAAEVHAAADDELYLSDQGEAVRLCELLGRLEGAHIDLPEADEWEMAARGTDGRRYPWGNGFERDPKKLSSPWGLEQTVGHQPQWTMTKKEAKVSIVSGGESDFRCSSRQEVSLNNSASLFAVRPVVRTGRA